MKLACLLCATLLVGLAQPARGASSPPGNPVVPARPGSCPDALVSAWENWRKYRTPSPDDVLDELIALTQEDPYRLQEAAGCLAYFNTTGAPLNNEYQSLMMRRLYYLFDRDVRKSPLCLQSQKKRINRQISIPREYTQAHIVSTQNIVGFGNSCPLAAQSFWRDVDAALEKLKNNPPSHCVSTPTMEAKYVVAPMPRDPTATELCCYNKQLLNYSTPEWQMTGWCLKKSRPLEQVLIHYLNECKAKMNAQAGYVANSASLVVHKNEVKEEYAALKARENLACTDPASLQILNHYSHYIVEDKKEVKLDIYCTAKQQCLDKTSPDKPTPVKQPIRTTDPVKTSTPVPTDNSNPLPAPRPSPIVPTDAIRMK